jgi:threonine dehydratase
MSGGGLLSGIGLAIKGMDLRCTIVGVQSKSAPYLYEHFNGRSMASVQELPTIADGLAGPVEAGSITLDIIPEVTDEVMLVDEADIRATIHWLFQQDEVVEPSAAVAIAAARNSKIAGQKVVIASGGNIDQALLKKILEGGRG